MKKIFTYVKYNAIKHNKRKNIKKRFYTITKEDLRKEFGKDHKIGSLPCSLASCKIGRPFSMRFKYCGNLFDNKDRSGCE